MLRELLDQRAILLVLDDVWNTKDSAPFDVLSERSKLLVTTRKNDVSRSLGAEPHGIATLPNSDALGLLARYAELDVQNLPPEAADLARECGELPLALAMIGSHLRGKPADRWQTALANLRAADHNRLQAELPNYPHASLIAAMEVSLNDLEPPLRARYLELAVFPEDTAIPEATLATYWAPEGLTVADVQMAVDTFIARSLARRDADGRLVLHDVQRDFVRVRTHDKRQHLDSLLLAAYRGAAREGLPAGPNDGYFFQHIVSHLRAAEGPTAVRTLLLDPAWLRAKLHATDVTLLLADFDELRDISSDPPLQLLRDAVRLSAHELARRPD
jgi:hypothetical protein